MVPLEFFKRASFSAPVVLVAFVGLALFGVVYFITLYFQNVKGWSPEKSGLAALPLTAMVMLIGPMAGKLQSRFSPRQLMTTGMLMVSGGLVGLSQLQVDSSYNSIWPFYVLMGAGWRYHADDLGHGDGGGQPAQGGRRLRGHQLRAAGGRGGRPRGARGGRCDPRDAPVGVRRREAAGRGPRPGPGLEELVIGAQGQIVGRIAGPAAQQNAFEAFVTGVQGAMWVGAALTLPRR